MFSVKRFTEGVSGATALSQSIRFPSGQSRPFLSNVPSCIFVLSLKEREKKKRKGRLERVQVFRDALL